MKKLFYSLWKLAKFLMSFWQTLVSFPSNFASIFSVIKHNSSVYFQLKHYILLFNRTPLKCNFLRHSSVQVKIRQIMVSILKQQVNSSSNFASFFTVMIHNSSVNFKLMHFLLWIKGSHQGPNFETFESSGKNLPNS